MSNWKDKSKNNILAAETLINNSLTNQSIHCCYYSCVQYVYHILCTALNFETSYIESQSYKDPTDRNTATHTWLRREIFQSLMSRGLENDAENFNTDMSTLVRVRVIADYKQEIVLMERAKGLLVKATKTIELLQKNYE